MHLCNPPFSWREIAKEMAWLSSRSKTCLLLHCIRILREVKGRYWSRFMENKMAVWHFTDNKFGISRFTRKNVFIRAVFLTLVKNYNQRTALFDVLTILPLLVLGAVKKKPSSLFRSWGSALASSNTESLSSERSSSYLVQDKWRLGVDTVQLCCNQSAWIDLVTVFDSILTSRQARAKLQCLYENQMWNNFLRTAVLKIIRFVNWSFTPKDFPENIWGRYMH